MTYSKIVNLRKFFAYVSTLNEKNGSTINFSKWVTLIKQFKAFFKDHFIDSLDLEKLFYDVVRTKTPSEMNYEDFVDSLTLLSRKLVKICITENESQNILLANDELLFNRFLQIVIKPFCEEL